MKVKDIYHLRKIFHGIKTNFNNDVGNRMRADNIKDLIDEGVEICDKEINKREPLKYKTK